MPIPTLAEAKWAFTTRLVDRESVVGVTEDVGVARAGDLILARVERVGSHKRLQLASGAHSALWEGDLIVAACGDRYAVDQFAGLAAIDAEGCDLLAGGGVLGRLETKNARMSAPTRLVPLGRLVDADGAPVTLARDARPRPAPGRPATVIGVVGTGMNSGKTTAAAALIRGLTAAGSRVAGLKATGTGAFGDVQAYADAGAAHVADFTDDGLASTYRQPLWRLTETLDALLGHAAAAGCDVAVVEIADGLLQRETAAMLADPATVARFDGWLFAAGDALSAIGGLVTLQSLGLHPLAVTGLLTRAPLAVAEFEAASEAWVLDRSELAAPAAATALRARARRLASGAAAELAA
jgi:hypothetical protein